MRFWTQFVVSGQSSSPPDTDQPTRCLVLAMHRGCVEPEHVRKLNMCIEFVSSSLTSTDDRCKHQCTPCAKSAEEATVASAATRCALAAAGSVTRCSPLNVLWRAHCRRVHHTPAPWGVSQALHPVLTLRGGNWCVGAARSQRTTGHSGCSAQR